MYGHCLKWSVEEVGCSSVEVIRMFLSLSQEAGQNPESHCVDTASTLMWKGRYLCVIPVPMAYMEV